MSDEWLAWEGMAKEIAMRGQEDEYFIDAGSALAIRSLCQYNEIASKAMLKIEGGLRLQDWQNCCKMMIVHTKVNMMITRKTEGLGGEGVGGLQ
jgi:hypothetical protein